MSSFSGDSCWMSARNMHFWYHRFLRSILQRGIIPKHVAFIMDGNRTFAKRKSLQTITIHEKGYGKLTEVVQWCLNMGIFEVTFWAFSIENFRRSKEEVDVLMNLACDKFRQLIEEWRNLHESGVCVRVVGNLTLIPKDLLTLILIAMLLTKDNNRFRLNIALSYTGKDEMLNASNFVLNGIRNSEFLNATVNADLVDRCLYTYSSPPPDMIIRTSGQYRLSDFLMWQGAYSYLHITNVLWPDFSLWNFMYAIFCFQHFVNRVRRPLKRRYKLDTKEIYEFTNHVQTHRLREILEIFERDGQPLDWEKLISLTKKELHDYYSQYIKSV